MITINPADMDQLYEEFCENHCSNRHHPNHRSFRECLNCSVVEFSDWLVSRHQEE
jgi:succinate dehydrogenase flavin-adding protein (antitoxin of CptAB toxin-antitoxin module)